MEQWYVIQTKPRQETIAEENLERQGYICFCPRIGVWRKFRGSRRSAVEAYFPNYVFIHLDMQSTNVAPIRSTCGVSKLVRFGNLIPAVPPALITTLRQQTGDDGLLSSEHKDFTPGQIVRIETGPLAGISAIFEAPTGQRRAILLLQMLGKTQRITVPIDSLEYKR